MQTSRRVLLAAFGLAAAGCTTQTPSPAGTSGPATSPAGSPTPRQTPTASPTTTPATPTQPAVATESASTSIQGTNTTTSDLPFQIETLGTLNQPWALSFMPGTDLVAITERGGRLVLRAPDGTVRAVQGTPDVVVAGQGGLGDVLVREGSAGRYPIYLTWAERGSGGVGAAMGRGTLDTNAARIDDFTVIWRQQPKVSGTGHFSHKMVFSPDGQHLFVSSGERQQMTPAQDLSNTLGKILRLNPDGTAAAGNPFADRGGASAEIWSYGHRNVLGVAFDASGRLWASEMGPQGGDELNLIVPGGNYGWPNASNGSHYGGRDIPDHRAGDGYVAPVAWWNPSISPGSLAIMKQARSPEWQGNAVIGALSGQALVRVVLDGTQARSTTSYSMGTRIRETKEAPDGALWLLSDDGRILRLTPR